jgi:glycosyltransferase involved in cell wall biosynthesis
LVMGDLPLRCHGPQILFLQQSNLLGGRQASHVLDRLRFSIARKVLRWNLPRVKWVIVQSEVMRSALERDFPEISSRVRVVPQPVPSWLLRSGLRRRGRIGKSRVGLDLVYPASGYHHKNHILLSKLDYSKPWPVNRLTLTISVDKNPAPNLDWVRCVGFLSPPNVIEEYSQVDALLFLSREESYGFPLVEAMFVGLPVVCPDLPYARVLCGDNAIYFDADEPDSLFEALTLLQSRLESGWWPDWSAQLSAVPASWQDVARNIVRIMASFQ